VTSTPQDKQNQQQDESNETGRWASLIGGGAMVLMGLRQRSLRGALTAIAGGTLAYKAATTKGGIQEALGMDKTITVEKTVTINKPADELYRFWRNLENLPHFMKHLKSVTVISDKRSHWVANAPMGASVEWDADIIEEQQNEYIS